MKINLLPVVERLSSITFIVLAIVVIPLVDSLKAQENSQILNGLFTPTNAQRFFEQGRREFQREEKIFVDREDYFNGDILKIKEEFTSQEKKPKPNFFNNQADRDYQLFDTPDSDRQTAPTY
jgi:hypothetical protein